MNKLIIILSVVIFGCKNEIDLKNKTTISYFDVTDDEKIIKNINVDNTISSNLKLKKAQKKSSDKIKLEADTYRNPPNVWQECIMVIQVLLVNAIEIIDQADYSQEPSIRKRNHRTF